MRKIVLILCLAFVVLGFGWPTIILPYTKYSYSYGGVETSYTFQLNGKVKKAQKTKDKTTLEATYKYKINFKDNSIEIQITDKTVETLKIDSFFNLSIANVGSISMSANNKVAIGVSIGVGVLALLLVILAPSKKY